jgi:uncharacterized protein (TIGR02266 family)
MVFSKLSVQTPKVGIIQKEIKEQKALTYIERVEMAFFQITSVINAQKDINAILEVIVRESHNCLRVSRSTIFLMDEKSGILKIHCTYASDLLQKEVGLPEERDVAQKTLRQNKPFLFGGPGNLPDLLKNQERERKITSLMGIPLSSGGKTMGVLSAVLINEEYAFDEKDLQFFSSFANLASTALGMADLLEEITKAKSLRITYERYLDNILNQLQVPSEKEPPPIDSHRVEMQTEQQVDAKDLHGDQDKEKVTWVQGTITLKEEPGMNRRQDERVETIVRVEFEEQYWGFTKNLSKGGAFILTPDPMDLGEEFFMKLHMPDGGEPIEVTCKVVWTNKYGKETHDMRRGMGIKFLRLQPKIQDRIEEYIKSRKNGK